jgi:hypothetical protein
MATPTGPLPTATLATTEMVAVSMAETLFEPKLMHPKSLKDPRRLPVRYEKRPWSLLGYVPDRP